MAISVGGGGDEGRALSDINTTPLVDVMLVLLIIFLITIPVAIQTAPVSLPKVNNQPTTTKPENIIVGVDREGNYYWNASMIKGGKDELKDRMIARVKAACPGGRCDDIKRIPEVHIRADKDTPYQFVGGVIYVAQVSAIQKVALISEQDHGDR